MNVHTEVCPSQPITFHPLANIFPWLEGAALDALRDDIRANGVREPIVFLDGAILDGRNRYQCARDLGIPYPRREFGGDPLDGADPLAFVISLNLTRRHLSESQRAMVAQKLANLKPGRPEENAQIQAVSQSDAARLLNVSRASVQTARKVANDAPAEVARAVETGHMPVSLAAKVADLPDEAKAEVVAAPPEKMREVARTELQRSILAAVSDAGRRPSNRNPHHVADGQRDRVIIFTGHCRRISEADDLDQLARFDGHPEFRRQMIAEARSAFAALSLFIQKVEEA